MAKHTFGRHKTAGFPFPGIIGRGVAANGLVTSLRRSEGSEGFAAAEKYQVALIIQPPTPATYFRLAGRASWKPASHCAMMRDGPKLPDSLVG